MISHDYVLRVSLSIGGHGINIQFLNTRITDLEQLIHPIADLIRKHVNQLPDLFLTCAASRQIGIALRFRFSLFNYLALWNGSSQILCLSVDAGFNRIW